MRPTSLVWLLWCVTAFWPTAGTVACGSSASSRESPSGPEESGRADGGRPRDVVTIALDAEDVAPVVEPLCGASQFCDPDLTAVCTPYEATDAGDNTGPEAGRSDARTVDASRDVTSLEAAVDSGRPRGDSASGWDVSFGLDAPWAGDDASTFTDASMDQTVQGDGDADGSSTADATDGVAADTSASDGAFSDSADLDARRPVPTPDALVDGRDFGHDVASTGETVACRVVVQASGHRVAACTPAGIKQELQFCSKDAECAPGLACVGESNLGKCLAYCCGAYGSDGQNSQQKREGHYCTLQPLVGTNAPVPVWVKLDMCTLLQDNLLCIAGTGCSVVTNDGKTTCVPTGPAGDDESCAVQACQREFVCTGSIDRRCRRICRLQSTEDRCGTGRRCVGSPAMPAGFGVCVQKL